MRDDNPVHGWEMIKYFLIFLLIAFLYVLITPSTASDVEDPSKEFEYSPWVY